MPTARQSLAVATVDGKIFAVGGENQTILSIMEKYNPVTNVWTARAPMPTPRVYATANSAKGSIYVIGGLNSTWVNTVEVYTPPTQ